MLLQSNPKKILKYLHVYIEWNPVSTVANEPKKFAVLTRAFLYTKMCGGFGQAAQKKWLK